MSVSIVGVFLGGGISVSKGAWNKHWRLDLRVVAAVAHEILVLVMFSQPERPLSTGTGTCS